MGFWLGTLVFLIIQAAVTLSINALGQPGNKGCVARPAECALTKGWESSRAPSAPRCRLTHIMGMTAVAQLWIM